MSQQKDDSDANLESKDGGVIESQVGNVVQSQGVTRMEAVYREAQTNRKTFYLIGASVLVCAWAYSLDSSTTSYYSLDVSSYYKQHSSVLSTLSIATSIISAVCKPFIAKISDITSRPYTYILALLFYILGYIIVATSHSVAAYIVGEAFVAVGSSGLDLINDIIVADLTPLEWRGFVSSLLSTPFIINTWFSGKIVDAILKKNQWRWGYGMFAIIMPVALGPAIVILIFLDRKAQKQGVVNMASSNAARRAAKDLAEKDAVDAPHGVVVAAAASPNQTWSQSLRHNLEEIDAFGLILLGFGWSLLLLPFSLKTYAKHGWRNESLIAMMVVGGVCLIAYVVYEIKWAKIPSAPRRLVFNKTFIMAIVIDSFYFLAGNMRGLYWGSYVYIAKPWSYQNWVYYGNTLTLALCIFGPIAGLLQRWTHRYKAIQIFGLCLKIIGMGILLDGHQATDNTAAMVMSMLLIGAGGAMSVVGSRVASQASVPHQDVALAISLLSLWSKIGSAIGSAVVAVIWSYQMPKQLREHLPAGTTETTVKKLFSNIKAIRKYEFDSPMRQGAIVAYRNMLYYCLAPALALAFIPLVAACFQTNYYLGKQQNAVTNEGNDGLPLAEEDRKREATATQEQKGSLSAFLGWKACCVTMPPFPIDLFTFWRDNPQARVLLELLVDKRTLLVQSQQCGYAQAIQSRLRAFDSNKDVSSMLKDGLPSFGTMNGNVDYFSNPRRNLIHASKHIFKDADTEHAAYDRAMEGLTYLDVMERQRILLVNETRRQIENEFINENAVRILEELDSAATLHFTQFHMGFRACVLIRDLLPAEDNSKAVIDILIHLNAMFPSDSILKGDDDFELSPVSAGLRDSIRFSIFEHIMSDSWHTPQQFQSIHMKLMSWCDLPDYRQARQALKRYIEEVKKIEEICFELMHEVESRPTSLRAPSFIGDISFSSISEGSRNSMAPPTPIDSEGSSPTERNTVLSSRTSNTTRSPGAPPVPHPLLKGMPGRELSASKIDGARFAGDLDAPPILVYPNDLSRIEYDEHPLAKNLDMTSRQKAQLGLVIPKQLHSRDF